MASAKAWGTITIVDTTDIGQFSVTPSSNRATTVIYTPDNNTYTPNWADSSGNVTITPVVYYGGTQLNPGIAAASNPKVTWTYKTNDATSFTTLPSWATAQSDGTLKLTGNPFTSSNISSVTFKCTANYNEPATNLPLTAAGEITYSVVRQAASVPYVRITGENVFKYNTSQTLVGAESITLTATYGHCTISKWQYKNGNSWTDIANTAGSATLEINAKSTTHAAYFKNDVATFRVVTSVDGLIDVHVITKIHDGAAGQSTLAAILTNEDQMIPADETGAPVDTAFTDAYTQLTIFRGSVDETSQWEITISAPTDIQYQKSTDGTNWDDSSIQGLHYNHVRITGMATGLSVGSVTFTAKKTGETDIVKKFTLTKVKTGADGADAVTYILEASNQVVRGNADTTDYTVLSGSIKIYAYKRTGAGDRVAYATRYAVFKPDGTQFYPASGTSSLPTSGAEFAYGGSILPKVLEYGYAVVKIFAGAATSSAVLDTLTLTAVRNGAQGVKGEDGTPGTSPISVVLGNYSDVLSCGVDDKILPTSSQTVINIPFTAYEGINRVACSVTAGDLHYNSASTKATKNTQGATASSDGYVKYTIPAGGKLVDAIANQTVTLTFTVTKSDGNTAQFVAYYTLGRSQTGDTGASVYYGYIETPQGDVITNKENSVTLEAHLHYGASERSDTYFQWAKYGTDGYELIGDKTTTKTLTVNPSDVNGSVSYRCQMYYTSGTLRYTAYVTVRDKTDPIQAEILSTAGDKFVNGIAEGAMYVKVYRNGVEIDPLPTEIISKTAPASPSANDMYFKIDTATNSVKLMKYVSNAWAEQTYTPTASYTWSYLDKDGEETHPSGMATSGKIVYVDGDFVNTKLTAFCEVEVV
jgi:hypothetical protein